MKARGQRHHVLVIPRSDTPATPEDDAGPSDADDSPEEIPAIRLAPLDQPEPPQRRGDIDPAVRRECSTRERRVHAAQTERKDDEAGGARQGQKW